jgi:hypothetical protein
MTDRVNVKQNEMVGCMNNLKSTREGCYELIKQYFTHDGVVKAQVLLDLNSQYYVAERIFEGSGRVGWSLHFLQQCAEEVCRNFVKNPF